MTVFDFFFFFVLFHFFKHAIRSRQGAKNNINKVKHIIYSRGNKLLARGPLLIRLPQLALNQVSIMITFLN